MKLPALRKALKARQVAMIEVESSVIHEVGYIKDERCLVVVFNSGEVYAYHEVPRKEFVGIINAWSPGHQFQDHIRDKFVYNKL